MNPISILISLIVTTVLTLSVHSAAAMGGDSSAGGGGSGTLSFRNWNGTLKVSLTSELDGLGGTVLKYFKLAGAREKELGGNRAWDLEGSGGSISEEESDELDGGNGRLQPNTRVF